MKKNRISFAGAATERALVVRNDGFRHRWFDLVHNCFVDLDDRPDDDPAPRSRHDLAEERSPSPSKWTN
jgi:hypothetical protein